MLRHASLRALVARAVYDATPPDGAWPAHDAARVGAWTVRNLPQDTTPERAAGRMEATVATAQELKRRTGVKGWRARVRKPALGYTLHWEGMPSSDEAIHVRETIDILTATALQAVVVRRVDGGSPRTIVILNTVHPETGLVTAGGQVYLDLLRWHLSRENDPQARAALQRGKVATILESLRRQDRRILTLPDRLQWALKDVDVPPGVPHSRIGTNTLAMVLRCGPSGW